MSEFHGPKCQEMRSPTLQFSKIYRGTMSPHPPRNDGLKLIVWILRIHNRLLFTNSGYLKNSKKTLRPVRNFSETGHWKVQGLHPYITSCSNCQLKDMSVNTKIIEQFIWGDALPFLTTFIFFCGGHLDAIPANTRNLGTALFTGPRFGSSSLLFARSLLAKSRLPRPLSIIRMSNCLRCPSSKSSMNVWF